MTTAPRVDYQTHPSQYRHWKLKFEGPVATLCAALQDLDRTVEAFAVLDEALARRPDDGELALFAAQERARYWATSQEGRK